MSEATAAPANGTAALEAPAPPVWPMYRALVGVGLLCGVLIVGVYELTKPIIARNQAEALQRAVFDVVPGAATSATFGWDGDTFVPGAAAPEGAPRVYAAYGEDGALVGVALEGAAQGYADVIRTLYGYRPGDEAVVGLRVLESRETPGLGDAIEKDEAFRSNFRALDVRVGGDGELAHRIEAVPPGEKDEPWQVDTITGATISSTAVATALAESTATWVPRVHAHLDALAADGAAGDGVAPDAAEEAR